MSVCAVHESGQVDLYFYGELEPVDAAAIDAHLRGCSQCRQALEDLSIIQSALATRPVVAAPAGGDWSRFMTRLDDAVARETRATGSIRAFVPRSRRGMVVGYLAMAALLALVTASVAYLARTRAAMPAPSAVATAVPAEIPVAAPSEPIERAGDSTAMAAISEQHFERSKLVVLGLATKDPSDVSPSDWAYERQLASSLLDDTRMYRRAAEQRGMSSIARVMGDLELVLLQASTPDQPDTAALERVQRLIRKRDLVTKMEAVNTAGM